MRISQNFLLRSTRSTRHIPAVLSAIVGKLMGKTAEERYQNAAGLQADLQTCLASLDAAGHIPSFPLGRHDFSDRLQIPQKLYGRDTQIAILLQAFERATDRRRSD